MAPIPTRTLVLVLIVEPSGVHAPDPIAGGRNAFSSRYQGVRKFHGPDRPVGRGFWVAFEPAGSANRLRGRRTRSRLGQTDTGDLVMTLIIAVEEDGRVIMGADSAVGKPEEFYVLSHMEKIAQCGRYLLGHCGNARIGQVLHHLVEWPEPPDSGPLAPFLVQQVMPEVRRAIQDAGAAQQGPAILGDTTVVLMALRGELYVVGADLTVVRTEELACIGCGRHAAYPAMEALKAAGVEPAHKRIEMALEIVARRVPVVEPPFRFLENM